jgi:hypothetical protein
LFLNESGPNLSISIEQRRISDAGLGEFPAFFPVCSES